MSIRRWILLAAWLGTAAPSQAIDFAFQDPQYSFQSLRALGYAVSGGADIGEVLHTVRRITEGDDESWFREWNTPWMLPMKPSRLKPSRTLA